MTDVQAFVTLLDFQRFQEHMDSATTSIDSFSLQLLKMRDNDDDKYTACLLPFREGTDEESSKLFLWVLHFVDQVKLAGLPEHYAACCRYFPRAVTSLLSKEFTMAYDILPNLQALNQEAFHGLIATLFARQMKLSKVTLFHSYLLTGPRKPSDMANDIHYNVLQKFSSGLTLLSSDPSVVPFTDVKLKKAFYLVSPVTWRTAFEQANLLIPDSASHFDVTSLQQAMHRYQQSLQEQIREHQRLTCPRDNHTTNTRNVRSHHSGSGGLRGKGCHSNSSGRGTTGRSSGGNRLSSASGNCPYRTTILSHAHHNWLDCLYNPQSGNFDQTKFNALQARSQTQPSGTPTSAAAPAPASSASSGSANATSRRPPPTRTPHNDPSKWGTRRSTDYHVNDAVSVSTTTTGDNHANKSDSGL